jgi:hypothetical protein
MLKKNMFGDDHEIKYDSIINHDTYTFLRISLEVPRGQDTEALVLLNGQEIGKVFVERNGKKTVGYFPFRKCLSTGNYVECAPTIIRKMGKAIASIITDYVRPE